MSLDLARLQNVREQGGKTIARCPACAERGMDETGEHLIIQPDGRFGCVVHPGPAGKPHRQRIAKLVGARGVPVIRVRVATAAPASRGAPVPIMNKPKAAPDRTRPESTEVKLGPPLFSLECTDANFREPVDGEWIVGLYREDDGTPVPVLLWADPNVDLFWDVARREHVKPPRLYLQLSEQPAIDPYPATRLSTEPFACSDADTSIGAGRCVRLRHPSCGMECILGGVDNASQ